MLVTGSEKIKELFDRIVKVNRVHFHAGCADGIMARNIFSLVLADLSFRHPDLLFRLENDGDSLWFPASPSSKLTVKPNCIFFDMAPKADQFEDFLKEGALIFDHHISNKPLFDQYKDQYPGQLFFSEDNSGTWLAYEVAELYSSYIGTYSIGNNEIYNILDLRRVANLISAADTWNKTDMEKFNTGRALALLIGQIGNDYYDIPDSHTIDLAKQMYKASEKRMIRHAEKVEIVDHCGVRIGFMNSQEDTSNMAEYLRNTQNLNLLVGYFHTINKDTKELVTSFSMRSDDTFHCKDISVRNGGGGHDKASGMIVPRVLDVISFIKDEVEKIQKEKSDISNMVDRFLSWKLPSDFMPDCGIKFDSESLKQWPDAWPTGTNLLNAIQAKEMIEYIIRKDK